MIKVCDVSEKNVLGLYWHTAARSIKIYKDATDSDIQKAVLEEDPLALCARFGVDKEGAVFWWNGDVNHAGVADAIGRIWILTGYWNFDERTFYSNNRFTQEQLNKTAQTPEGSIALDTLRNFSTNIRTIEMASAKLKF